MTPGHHRFCERQRLRPVRLLIALAMAAVLAACAGPAPKPSALAANTVLFEALSLVGTPYQWGGDTPDSGFDCSGLVQYVYRTAADIQLPRTSRAMSEIDAPRIGRQHLAPGDLLFFHGSSSRISHVAIYVGNSEFVHAPNSGGTVRVDRLDNPYWSSHFSFARRALHGPTR